MDKSTLDYGSVTYSGSVYRVVEGKKEKSWGGVKYPVWDQNHEVGYKYYRAASAVSEYYAAVGSSTTLSSGVSSPDILTSANTFTVSGSRNRATSKSSAMSTVYETLSYGRLWDECHLR